MLGRYWCWWFIHCASAECLTRFFNFVQIINNCRREGSETNGKKTETFWRDRRRPSTSVESSMSTVIVSIISLPQPSRCVCVWVAKTHKAVALRKHCLIPRVNAWCVRLVRRKSCPVFLVYNTVYCLGINIRRKYRSQYITFQSKTCHILCIYFSENTHLS